ncbi:hypothetical protein IW146_000009 [Coemansia sp. RSA 922]|nr:hypothetical protein H4S03_001610 [Coemansia sp. S3946]KAJ2047484.1 hypothetical protein H4S04_004415 [Coemansia sp. S16]KAJ2069305.1 hypothetical protein GGI08_000421 [Coemansia sp. S2]KAJ2118303.1 hypothetical protein IW146_000009 [Coemansia sp. RSA 922]KAJ2352116.1 hypothetical protein GGH92_001453 [Coemansia sp. RSA 2673]
MIYETADHTKSSSDVEMGETQEPLLKTRLDEIGRDVRAHTSTWVDLRQQYPPGGSCFEPFNFLAISWSSISNEDVRGLGNDIDADEAYSQAAAMAAYGVEILSRALNGPTVDRELTKLANNLFATLCATLMDTRDWHRDSVTKAVAEKVEAFSNILNRLNSTPQTEDASSRMEGIERGGQLIDSHEVPRPVKLELENSPTIFENEQRVSGSTTRDQQCSYSRGRSSSPDSQLLLCDHITAGSNLPGLSEIEWPGCSELPTQSSARPDHPPTGSSARRVSADRADTGSVVNSPMTVVYRENGEKTGVKINRRLIIRTELLKHGLSESAIDEYINQVDGEYRKYYDKMWNRWVEWCDRRGVDPTRKSVENLSERLSQFDKAKLATSKLEPAVYSVWRAIEGDIQSREAGH